MDPFCRSSLPKGRYVHVCFFITPTSVLQYPTVPPSTFHLPRSYYCTFVFATEVPLPMYLLLLPSVDLVEKDHGCGDRCEVELHVALHYYYVGPPMRRTLLLRTRLMISEIESYQVRYFCSLSFCNNSAKMGFCLCDSRAIASLLQSA